MRSIGCAIISFVLFYIVKNIKKDCWKIRGSLAILSGIMLGIAFVFMVFGI